MQLQEISQENWPEALALLCEGFSRQTEEFWQQGLSRWAAVVGDPFEGPVGYLGRDKQGEAQAVLLTFRAPEGWGDTPRVNFSSWYVREKHRFSAPLMLKRCSANAELTYTDFTPSEAVQRLLRVLGYTEVGARHLGFWTPRLAFSRGGGLVGAKRLLELLPADRHLLDALQTHQRLGCLVLGLLRPSGVIPVVLRIKTRMRSIRCAQVIYCPDVGAMAEHMPAIARHLLIRGILVLEAEFETVPTVASAAFDWGQSPRFVHGAWSRNQIDYLYSEIPVLGD